MLMAAGYSVSHGKPMSGRAVPTEARPAGIGGLSAAKLSEHLSMGPTPPATESALLEAAIASAVEKAVEASGYEPAPRAFDVYYDLPSCGGSIAPTVFPPEYLTIPRRPVQSVESVTYRGEPVDYTANIVGGAARIYLRTPVVGALPTDGEQLVVSATIGDSAGADPRFVAGVMMLAGYLYERRGEDVSRAYTLSGARGMLNGIRAKTGVL